eukprot:gene7705-8512_t
MVRLKREKVDGRVAVLVTPSVERLLQRLASRGGLAFVVGTTTTTSTTSDTTSEEVQALALYEVTTGPLPATLSPEALAPLSAEAASLQTLCADLGLKIVGQVAGGGGGEGSISLEVFQLSQQALQLHQQGLLSLTQATTHYPPSGSSTKKKKSYHARGAGGGGGKKKKQQQEEEEEVGDARQMVTLTSAVLLGNRETSSVDVDLFAVPLPLLISSSSSSSSKKGVAVQQQQLPLIAHAFPTPNELVHGGKATDRIASRYLAKVLRRVTTSSSTSTHASRQGREGSGGSGSGGLEEEAVSRLRDLHLLRYLQPAVNPATFRKLCQTIAITPNNNNNNNYYGNNYYGSNGGSDNGSNGSNSEIVLPEEVRLELDLIRQAYEEQ